MTSRLLRSTLLALSLVAVACSDNTPDIGTQDSSTDAGSAAGGTCPVGTPDCVDADLGGDGSDGSDVFPTDEAREQARGLLGMNEADLESDVRVGRRGEETFALTEDYVLGRRTVELDDTDGSGHRVVAVTVELPDGPETFELEAS